MLRNIICVLFLSTSIATATEKCVFYAAYQGSFMNLLADDTGPRALLVPSIYQNFGMIHQMGANCIILRTTEETSYPGEEGGGFPYNPAFAADGNKQIAVAQEIMASLAQAQGLNVIWMLDPGIYHLNITQTEPAIGAVDMKNYIKSVIVPGAFYNLLGVNTTQLNLVGLQNHSIQGNWATDPRVYGFIFVPEAKLWERPDGIPAQQLTWWQTYWPYFYSTAHTATTKAMMYYAVSPLGYPNSATMGSTVRNSGSPYDEVHTWKNFFGQYFPNQKPDLMGYEWYAGGPDWGVVELAPLVAQVELAAFAGVDAQYPFDYSVPVSGVWMSEGGANPWCVGTGIACNINNNYDYTALKYAYKQGVTVLTGTWAGTSAGWEAYMGSYPYLIPGPGGQVFAEPAYDFDENQSYAEEFTVTVGAQIEKQYPAPIEGWVLPLEWQGSCTDWFSSACFKRYTAAYGATAAAVTYSLPYTWAGVGVHQAFTEF